MFFLRALIDNIIILSRLLDGMSVTYMDFLRRGIFALRICRGGGTGRRVGLKIR